MDTTETMTVTIQGVSSDADAVAVKQRQKGATEAIKKQLLYHEKGIINPRTSSFVPIWDIIMSINLLLTAILTPFEVCLISNPSKVWVVFNLVVNTFFVCDMVLQFFIAYQESPKMGGRWVVHRPKIIRNYLKTWFILDLVSTISFKDLYTFVNGCSLVDGCADSSAGSKLRSMRLIKLVRLIKLLKVLGASRLVERWQIFIGLSFAQMTMIKFALMTVFLVHFMACIWSNVAIGWEYVPEDDLESDTTWIVAGNYSVWVEDRPMRIYTIAFYTAVVAMFGGVGSIIPHNHTEFVTMTCMMILGSFVWAWVIGSLCGILATLDPQATAFRNTMDELNYFMAESNFPTEHKVRLREFFRHRKDFDRVVAYETLLTKMSSHLKGDTALLLSIETIRPVWYLHDDHCEKEFLAITALHMHHAVYESQEQLPIEDLTVLIKGMIALRLKITTKGGVFGEECIIAEQHSGLRADLYVSCVSFVMVVVISRETLFELVENFPYAKRWLTRCSKILMLRAAFRKAYGIYLKEKKIKTESSELMKPRIAPEETSKWKKAATKLKAARRQFGTKKRLLAQPIRDPPHNSPHNSHGGAAIFADVMHKKNKASITGSPMIQRRQSVSVDTEDSLHNAKELRHAMSTLELQQLSVENKVQTMLEMLTQVVAKVDVLCQDGPSEPSYLAVNAQRQL